MENQSTLYLCKDTAGNILFTLEQMDETALQKSGLPTHCLAIVKMGDDYLLDWNKWRQRYEILGGLIEVKEPSKGCKCSEELRIEQEHFIYLGAIKYSDKAKLLFSKRKNRMRPIIWRYPARYRHDGYLHPG